MGFLFDTARSAGSMIVSLDPDVCRAVWTSVRVSAGAIVVAALLGVPVGLAVGLGDFPFKRAAVTVLNSLVAVPTVLVGLVVYGFLSRRGPLGSLGLLFTPGAIALETSKGEFSLGVALGIILMSVALFINIFLSLLQQR